MHSILLSAIFLALIILVVTILNPKKNYKKSSSGSGATGFPEYIISDLSATGFPEAPLGARAMFITVFGSGGGGCGGQAGLTGYGGGGGALINSVFLPLPASNYSVVIGFGGTGGTTGGVDGNTGGVTRVIDIASGIVLVEAKSAAGGSTSVGGVGGNVLLGTYGYSYEGSNGGLGFGGGSASANVNNIPVQQGTIGGGSGGDLGLDGQLFGGGGASGIGVLDVGGDGAQGGIIVNYI